MISSLEEDPSFVADDVFCDWNDTWFGICRRFEDLVGYVAVGGENNESRIQTSISVTAI